MDTNILFTEKYRPKTLKSIILLDRVRKQIGDGLIKQNTLFYSDKPGTGKTSLVKILTEDYTTLYINASKDRGIEVVRNEIEKFLQTKPLIKKKHDIKIVWLEELHNGTKDFYKSLFALIEKYAKSARFIATCNWIKNIPKPLLSRFGLIINFAPQNKDEEEKLFHKIRKRILTISDKYELTWNDEILDIFIKTYFPDIRKIISEIQNFVNSGITSVEDISDLDKTTDFTEIFEMIINPKLNNEIDVFQLIRGKYAGKGNDIFHSLTNDFPEWIRNKNNPAYLSIRPQAYISIADWMNKACNTNDFDTMVIAAIFQCNNFFKNVNK